MKNLTEKYVYILESRQEPQLRVLPNGTKTWKLNGQYHRVDGPAIESFNGSNVWFLNGELHRTDGPAVEYSSGFKGWFVNGILHRTDGPAIENSNGHKEWWVNGKEYTEDQFKKYPEIQKEIQKGNQQAGANLDF